MAFTNSFMSHDGRILPLNYRIPSSCDDSFSSSVSSSSSSTYNIDHRPLRCLNSGSSFSDDDSISSSLSSISSALDGVIENCDRYYQQKNPQEEENDSVVDRERRPKTRKKNRHKLEEDEPVPRALELSNHVIESIHVNEETKSTKAEIIDRDNEQASLPEKPPQLQQGALRQLTQLHGRSREEANLLKAYRNRIHLKKEASHLVIVSGAQGMGKSVLAQSLQDHVGENGFFVTWTFKSSSTNMDGFRTAFTNLASQVAKSPYLESIRANIQKELNPVDCAVLLDMAPMMKVVLPPDYAKEGITKDSIRGCGRGLSIFRSFFRCLSDPKKHPLIVVLDNCHYSVNRALVLVEEFVTDTGNEGAFFVLTRDDFTKNQQHNNARSGLDKLLQVVLKEQINLPTEIQLSALTKDVSNKIVADLLHVEGHVSAPMTDCLQYYTKGNPFMLIELLRLMVENYILTYDQSSRTWNCKDQDKLLKGCVKEGTCDIDFAKLHKRQLQGLSEDDQHLLSTAACLGTLMNSFLLEVILSEPDVNSHLDRIIAQAAGLVVQDPQSPHQYRFAHEGIKNAAYELIMPEERECFHLFIVQKLLHGISEEEMLQHQTYYFILFSQMKACGNELMNPHLDQGERIACASVCLQATQQLVQRGNFNFASEYLDFGIRLLKNNDGWRECYDLLLALYNSSAEVLYSIGEMNRARERIETIQDNARTFEDTIQACCTQINMLNSNFQTDRALELGLNILQRLGQCDLPSKPSLFQVFRAHIQMKRFMKRYSDEHLLSLPHMTHPQTASAIMIINLITFKAYMERPYLVPFLAYRAVRLTVEHGLCGISSAAFGIYGFVLGSMGNIKGANRYGKLSLQLLDKFGAKQWLPRVYVCAYAGIFPWTQDLRICADHLKRAFTVGIETGDVEFALISASESSNFALLMGDPLPALYKQMQDFDDHIASMQKNNPLLVMYHSTKCTVEALLEADRERAFEMFGQYSQISPSGCTSSNFLVSFWLPFKQVLLAIIYSDYTRTVDSAKLLRLFMKKNAKSFDLPFFFIYDSLSRAASCRDCDGNIISRRKKRRALRVMRSHIATIEKTNAKYNPRAFSGIAFLLKAEVQALSGNIIAAHKNYISSMALFQQNRMLSMHAITCERAGRLFLSEDQKLQDVIIAKQYMNDAIDYFDQWGARGKANELRQEILNIIE